MRKRRASKSEPLLFGSSCTEGQGLLLRREARALSLSLSLEEGQRLDLRRQRSCRLYLVSDCVYYEQYKQAEQVLAVQVVEMDMVDTQTHLSIYDPARWAIGFQDMPYCFITFTGRCHARGSRGLPCNGVQKSGI